MDSASSLASVLLEALDHPVREKMTQRDSEEGLVIEAMRNQGGLEQGTEKLAEVVQQGEENWGQEKPKDESESVKEDKVNAAKGTGGQSQSNVANPLHRKTRGYFQNIDLGLQDNWDPPASKRL